MTNIKRKSYTIAEEIFNAITHGAGAMLSIVGLVFMVVFSARQGDNLKVVSSAVYGGTLILMYLMSTLYHAITAPRGKEVLQIVDHCSIFLLIAGTYTPFTLVSMNGAAGWAIFGVIWAAAVLGVVLNIVNLEKFKKLSMLLYVLMGWCIVFAIRPLIKSLAPLGILFLFLGGAAYSIGIIFYKMKSKKFFHGIWHIFVLLGSVFHFICILFFVIGVN